MRKPTVYEASKSNGGYIGAAGSRKRHRFDLSSIKPKDEPKVAPKTDAAGYASEQDMPDIPAMEQDPSDPGEVEPGKRGVTVAISVHHSPRQMSEFKKMQGRRKVGY